MSYKDVFLLYLKLFCKETTIHGLKHFVQQRTIFELCLWVLIIIVDLVGCISLVVGNWNRFVTNPSVVSLEKDFRNWNNIFPGHTFCLENKVELKKMNAYLYKTWNVLPNNTAYPEFRNFVNIVSSLTFEDMHLLSKYSNNETFNTANFLNLMNDVHPTFNLRVISENLGRNWTRVVTEMGICHTYNSVLNKYFGIKPGANTIVSTYDTPVKCHFLNRQCYIRLESNPNWITTVYVHSPYEMLDLSNAYSVVLTKGVNLEVGYRPLQTHTTKQLEQLSPFQRHCRFFNEPFDYSKLPIYTLSLCKMMCKLQFSVDKCNCAPHFYANITDEPLCDVKGLVCLSKYVDEIMQSDRTCNCPQPCVDVHYIKSSEKKQQLTGYLGTVTTFRSKLDPSTIRFKREVIFGFEDLIVAFGGIAGFFLGISFLSVFEVLYFCGIAFIAIVRERK